MCFNQIECNFPKLLAFLTRFSPFSIALRTQDRKETLILIRLSHHFPSPSCRYLLVSELNTLFGRRSKVSSLPFFFEQNILLGLMYSGLCSMANPVMLCCIINLACRSRPPFGTRVLAILSASWFFTTATSGSVRVDTSDPNRTSTQRRFTTAVVAFTGISFWSTWSLHHEPQSIT